MEQTVSPGLMVTVISLAYGALGRQYRIGGCAGLRYPDVATLRRDLVLGHFRSRSGCCRRIAAHAWADSGPALCLRDRHHRHDLDARAGCRRQSSHMNLFHSFYFFTYSATTTGFGEIPYAFTDQQRLWATVCLYMGVVAWLYAISSIIRLACTRNCCAQSPNDDLPAASRTSPSPFLSSAALVTQAACWPGG